MSECHSLDISGTCDPGTEAFCSWSKDKKAILCQAKKSHEVAGGSVLTKPDFMAVPDTCVVSGNSLTCISTATHETVVSFVTRSGPEVFRQRGYVRAIQGSRAVIKAGCKLKKCQTEKHAGTLYDHFSCQCPTGA